jgi:hypothetical protein
MWALGALVPWASAGIISGPFTVTNDASTNISTANTYTHLLDFIADGSPATINGVGFTAAGTSGTNWSSTNFGGLVTEGNYMAGGLGTGAVSGSGAEKLLKDFYYNSASDPLTNFETLTLTGLTPGTQYETHVYYRAWESAKNRTTAVKFDEGGGLDQTITVNPDAPAVATAYYLSYLFTAGASGNLIMSYTPSGGNTGGSWHNYGVTNQVAVPEPSSLVLAGCGLAALMRLRRRRS